MRTLDMSDNMANKFIGVLEIHEIHEDGSVVVRQTPNVITYEARRIMAYLLSGENRDNKFVNFIRVGDNNTAPTRNDTALVNEIDNFGLTYTFPASDRVVFEGILPNVTPANGQTLREAGLFNNDAQMFARQIHGDIAKTSAIQLKYIWTIIFT